MPKVFISYRRTDNPFAAQSIHRELARQFGEDQVFFDIDSVPLGVDFELHLRQAVERCDVLVAVIGESWLEPDENGKPRLESPTDYVRIELETALNRGIPVIPVTVGDASLPDSNSIPPSIRNLMTRNATEVRSGVAYSGNIARLVNGIERLTHSPESKGRLRIPPALFVVVVIASFIVIASIWVMYNQESPLGSAHGESKPNSVANLSERRLDDTGQSIAVRTEASTTSANIQIGSFESVEVGMSSLDKPNSLEVGTTKKVELEEDARAYFKTVLPAGEYKIVLDMLNLRGAHTNLQGSLSVLDEFGASLQDKAIRTNEIDVNWRETFDFRTTEPNTRIFKVANDNDLVAYWITVVDRSAMEVPYFFGKVLPRSLSIGETATGNLKTNDYHFFSAQLDEGQYRLIADFENAAGRKTNIQGYVAVLNEDGGGQRKVLKFNEIDVAYRKVAPMSLDRNSSVIFKVLNTNHIVNYRMRVERDSTKDQ